MPEYMGILETIKLEVNCYGADMAPRLIRDLIRLLFFIESHAVKRAIENFNSSITEDAKIDADCSYIYDTLALALKVKKDKLDYLYLSSVERILTNLDV